MLEDTVMKELWEIKDRNAAKYGYNVRKMGRALQRLQAKFKHRIVRPKRRGRD
jgi:hypothetical protein